MRELANLAKCEVAENPRAQAVYTIYVSVVYLILSMLLYDIEPDLQISQLFIEAQKEISVREPRFKFRFIRSWNEGVNRNKTWSRRRKTIWGYLVLYSRM